VTSSARSPSKLTGERTVRDGVETSLHMHGVLEANDGQIVRAAALKRLTINIAYPTRRHLPAKVRCFVDFLVEKFAQMDFERRWTA
jgi:DNA-binding transcriptional LysR family regulator